MPTQTFMHLPDEKKRRIFLSVYHELERVPFPEMSINKIVKNAEISRGSFYQYFTDRDDVLGYFVSESSSKVRECMIHKFSDFEGDLFDFYLVFFREISDFLQNEYKIKFMHHVLPYVNIRKMVSLSEYIEKLDDEEKAIIFKRLGVGTSGIENSRELMDIIAIIESVLSGSVCAILSHGNINEIRETFERKINIIRKASERGAL